MAGNYASPETYRAPIRLVPELEIRETELQKLIKHFDQNWKQEGLPRDWYNFGKAGFSMNSQMNLLEGLDSSGVDTWKERTEQDMRGFTLEYLERELVHPAFYRKSETADGKVSLIDKKYDRGLTEMVDPRERNGSVKDTLGKIEEFIGNGGKAVVMTSPDGWTGLETDREIPIVYPDAWLFSFIDMGDRVVNFGIKTDFSLEDCRNAIVKLTGQDLEKGASVEDYVRAIAKINPDQGISSPADLVRVLREIRPGPYVFQDRTWDEVAERVGRLEELFSLDAQAEEIISDFRDFKGNTKFDYQKALAASLLRLSKLHVEKKIAKGHEYTKSGNVIYPVMFQAQEQIMGTYGNALNEVEKLKGCAGGGDEAESVTSIVNRLGMAVSFGDGSAFGLEEDKYGKRSFNCPTCKKVNIRPKDKLIEKCLHCEADVRC